MSRLEEITKKRKKAHEKLIALKSKVYEAFLEMGGGPATVSARFALEVMESVYQK